MSSKTNHPYNVLYIYPLFVYVTTETPWSGWEEISLRWGYLPREHSLVCSSKTIWMFTLTSVIDAPQVYIIYCNWVCKTTSTRTAHDFISHNALQLNKTIVFATESSSSKRVESVAPLNSYRHFKISKQIHTYFMINPAWFDSCMYSKWFEPKTFPNVFHSHYTLWVSHSLMHCGILI